MKRLLAVAILIATFFVFARSSNAAEPQLLPPFDGGTAWFNSKPLSQNDLSNKVVLVDFFDYTSLSSLRTLPYLSEWYKRYADAGFVIVTIFSSDIGFAADSGNAAAAVQKLGITWPVVVDGKKAIGTRYGATYAPHMLLFDHNGFRIGSVVGETNYPNVETIVQQLLLATHPEQKFGPVMALLPKDNYDKPNAITYPRTGSIRLAQGSHEIANPPAQLFGGENSDYTDTKPPHDDGRVYLQGRWLQRNDDLFFDGNSGYLALHYHAIEVASIMRPQRAPITVVVTQNGKPVDKADAGSDIQYDAGGQSYVVVDAARAYDLIVNKRWGSYDLRLYPRSSGLAVYGFDFETTQTGSDY
jgi:thiol-disulfide isomerase/thioredoxin